ncbi:hypothetical protein [Burkholderia pseudomallei]|uniref:hypothetical protein n=1 Tax=Burkholderia pseudomallei TaxID=28450 RepID=UPI001E554A5D|nr:hypothetical protein [Burkholderia pseudomallei]
MFPLMQRARVVPLIRLMSHRLRTSHFDLFGDIVVTHDDIVAWVSAIAPAYMSSERSFRHYVRNWRVVEKIKTAKAAGTFDSSIATGRDRRAYLARRFGF